MTVSRLHGVWRNGLEVVRFDVGMGRWWGFVAGRAFARDLLIQDASETPDGLALRFLSGGKPVVATIGQDGGLRLEAGGKILMFKRLEG